MRLRRLVGPLRPLVIVPGHISVDGIEVGGYSDPQWMRPGFTGWEAKNVTVVDNIVEGVGKRPLNIIGAQNCTITHNFLQSNPNYYYIVSISADNNGLNSKYITLSDNVFDRSAHWLQVAPGQDTGLQLVNNHFDGVWTGGAAGPRGRLFLGNSLDERRTQTKDNHGRPSGLPAAPSADG